eukprot:6781119-Prymnesium_polylepis.2
MASATRLPVRRIASQPAHGSVAIADCVVVHLTTRPAPRCGRILCVFWAIASRAAAHTARPEVLTCRLRANDCVGRTVALGLAVPGHPSRHSSQ